MESYPFFSRLFGLEKRSIPRICAKMPTFWTKMFPLRPNSSYGPGLQAEYFRLNEGSLVKVTYITVPGISGKRLRYIYI